EAHAAWLRWRTTSFADRARLFRGMAERLRSRKDELARLMAIEMGKPLAQGRAEVDKCAWVCEYYAEHAENHLAHDVIPTDAVRSCVAFDPLRVIHVVMPWNCALWQVYRLASPAVIAGNLGVLKHASNVPGCALVIEELFRPSGFPDGVFRTLLVGIDQFRAV